MVYLLTLDKHWQNAATTITNQDDVFYWWYLSYVSSLLPVVKTFFNKYLVVSLKLINNKYNYVL